MKRSVRIYLTLIMLVAGGSVMAQDIIIQQNETGLSRSDVRGQAFIPSEFGDGVGHTFGQDTVYLNVLSVYFSTDVVADTLYIYEQLPSSTANLDNGVGGELIGQSFAHKTEDGKTTYHFGSMAVEVNTTYYAVFRQDAELNYGESADVAGPYAGGKMLVSDGGSIVENDKTAVRFSAVLSLVEQVNQQDLLALVALYKATNGASWYSKWNLTNDPLTWHGVGWNRSIGRVVSLNLWSNRLEGDLPEEFWDLTLLSSIDLERNFLSGEISPNINQLINLRSLNLRNNKFTFLPELTLPSIEEIDIVGNSLQFDSFESNLGLIQSGIISILAQSSLPVFSDSVYHLDNDIELDFHFAGENNRYQWFKSSSSNPVTDISETPKLIIPAATKDVQGRYWCKVTNTIVEYDGHFGTRDFWLYYATEFLQDSSKVIEVGAQKVDFQFEATTLYNTIYYMALPSGSDPPLNEQVVMGVDSNGMPIDLSGSASTLNIVKRQIRIDGLEQSTPYDFYFVIEKNLTDNLMSRDSANFSLTTIEPIKYNEEPVLSYIGANRATLDVNVNRPGTLYYSVISEGVAPTTAEIINGTYGAAGYSAVDSVNQITNVDITNVLQPQQSIRLATVFVDTEEFNTEINIFEIITEPYLEFIDYHPKALHYGNGNVTISGTLNRDANAYYAVFEGSEEIIGPTLDELKSGVDNVGTIAVLADSIVTMANEEFDINLEGLKLGTAYQFLIYALDIDSQQAVAYWSVGELSEITGLQNLFNPQEISLYPNPVENELNIESNLTSDYEVVITSSNGQVVYTEEKLFASNTIKLESLKAGVYLVHVKTNDQSIWQRIIKK